ncbi:glycosyltransferase family 4 protein [Vibrio lentus]|uniref:glycosyltransferase family 4 protein n=1 Tax=Vibrio lentus TaxID=136468 RepID=UPI000C8508DC|nr:glycosyltransferase family 4 protein [Vibrio lentus]PMM56265.1 glycosyltransferase WbuB [Vibrio lentus]
MRLALIIDDYLPHSTRVGAKMFHELALQFNAMGHDVTVITPDSGVTSPLVEKDIDGIRVWRFLAGETKNVSKIKRAMNESMLSHNAWKAISSKVKPNTFDGIVYYSPSIFFGGLVSKLKHRCSCPAYLVLRDFFPQWVIDAGMIKAGSLIERYFRYFERNSYDQANVIGLMSEKNQQVFNKMLPKRYPTEILRNWASLKPTERQKISIREKLNLGDKIIYFYGGNIGHAQDMANLMRLALSMKTYEKAHFLFVGQGDEVRLINDLAMKWELDNFSYLPSVNQKEFKEILSDIDIGLFSLSAKHTAHNFPGKLLGYMVQSLPILGSVNEGNDLMDLLHANNAGLITINGDDKSFLANAIKLYQDVKLRHNTGNMGYLLLEREFSVTTVANKISDVIESINDEAI